MAGNVDKEIKIGVKLFEYIQTIGVIVSLMSDAYEKVGKCREILNEDETYIGKAKEEMQIYFDNLYMHTNKLITYYQAAILYIGNAFETHIDTDEKAVQIFDEIAKRYINGS